MRSGTLQVVVSLRTSLVALLALSACSSPGDQLRDPSTREASSSQVDAPRGDTEADGEIRRERSTDHGKDAPGAQSDAEDLALLRIDGADGADGAEAGRVPERAEEGASRSSADDPTGDEAREQTSARGCDESGEFEAKLNAEITARIQRHQALVRKAAAESEIDVDLLNAVCFLESKFDARARRGKNKGLMQLGPGATSSMAAQLDVRAAPYNPDFALRAGARLLSRLIQRYDGDVEWALVAYQRGVGGAAKIYVPGPVPEGHRSYVDRVLRLREDFAQSRWAARCIDPAVAPN